MSRSMRILVLLAVISLIIVTLVQTPGVHAKVQTGLNVTSGQPSFHGHTPRGPLGIPHTVATDMGRPAIHPHSVSSSSTSATTPSFTVADAKAYLLTDSQPEITPVQGTHLSIEKVLFVSDSEATQLMQGEDPGLPANAVVCFVLLKGPFHVQVDLPPGTPVGPDPTATEVGEVFDGQTGNLLEWGILDSVPARSPAQASTQLVAPSVTGTSQSLAAPSSTQSLAPDISYNCQPTRCYGTNWWPNAINGAYTFLNWSSFGALLGAGSPGGIIREAMWLVDKDPQHANDCYVYQSDLPSRCFVEAGIMSRIVNGSNETELYWADVRPTIDPAHPYYWAEHDGPIIDTTSSTDAIDIEIWRAGTISSDRGWCPIAGSEWCVDVYSEGDGFGITGTSGANHTNAMIVSGYQVGLELYGTSGATADYMYFDGNMWMGDTSTDNFQYQENDGQPADYMINNPADAWWSDGLAPAPGNDGGEWWTCLSEAGC